MPLIAPPSLEWSVVKTIESATEFQMVWTITSAAEIPSEVFVLLADDDSFVRVADLADFALVNGIYAEVFGEGVSPARACVEVAALPKGARVEIDCIALAAEA